MKERVTLTKRGRLYIGVIDKIAEIKRNAKLGTASADDIAALPTLLEAKKAIETLPASVPALMAAARRMKIAAQKFKEMNQEARKVKCRTK